VGCFFTLDRLGSLTNGSVIDLEMFDDIEPSELQTHADQLFPNGFTKFGERYFVSPWTDGNVLEPIIELVWEYARRHIAPTAPSRFTSLFAVKTEAEAHGLRSRLGGKGEIVEVEANTFFRADMDLLVHRADSIIVMSYHAELYWRGATLPGKAPTWEYLLEPPVRVLHASQ
jgi:hypothetical protein